MCAQFRSEELHLSLPEHQSHDKAQLELEEQMFLILERMGFAYGIGKE